METKRRAIDAQQLVSHADLSSKFGTLCLLRQGLPMNIIPLDACLINYDLLNSKLNMIYALSQSDLN